MANGPYYPYIVVQFFSSHDGRRGDARQDKLGERFIARPQASAERPKRAIDRSPQIGSTGPIPPQLRLYNERYTRCVYIATRTAYRIWNLSIRKSRHAAIRTQRLSIVRHVKDMTRLYTLRTNCDCIFIIINYQHSANHKIITPNVILVKQALRMMCMYM